MGPCPRNILALLGTIAFFIIMASWSTVVWMLDVLGRALELLALTTAAALSAATLAAVAVMIARYRRRQRSQTGACLTCEHSCQVPQVEPARHLAPQKVIVGHVIPAGATWPLTREEAAKGRQNGTVREAQAKRGKGVQARPEDQRTGGRSLRPAGSGTPASTTSRTPAPRGQAQEVTPQGRPTRPRQANPRVEGAGAK